MRGAAGEKKSGSRASHSVVTVEVMRDYEGYKLQGD